MVYIGRKEVERRSKGGRKKEYKGKYKNKLYINSYMDY